MTLVKMRKALNSPKVSPYIICIVEIWLLVLSSIQVGECEAQGYLNDVPTDVIIEPGDIYIGHLSQSHVYSSAELCDTDTISTVIAQENILAVYGLNIVNNNPKLLPNITMGMVGFDTCAKGLTSLGQALKFLPVGSNQFSARHPVVGVIGPYRSTTSAYTAGILNLFQIPMLSPTASSDDLKHRGRYGNFFRLVAPDSYQTKAMTDLLIRFNWTYVSVVYEESNYGFNCYTNLKSHTREAGICIGGAHGVSQQATKQDYELVVNKLMKDQKAKVVLMFIVSAHLRGFLTAVQEMGAKGMFIFLVSDAGGEFVLRTYGELVHGCIKIGFFSPTDKYSGITDYVETMTPAKNPNNPWLKKQWFNHFGCTYNATVMQGSECSKKLYRDLPGYNFISGVPTMQGPILYAQAIDSLIRDKCPRAVVDKGILKTCVTSSLVMEYLKRVMVETDEGPLGFDEYGALIQGYAIRQAAYNPVTKETSFLPVGEWTQVQGLHIMLESLVWWHDARQGEQAALPESVCAKPCEAGEFVIQGELKCCWDCFRCRDNEFVTDNGTSCRPCPYLHWPDQDNYVDCLAIGPSFLWWDDKYGMGLAVLAGLGLLVSCIISGVMWKNRHKKVIKGSSVGMMAVIILGLFLIFTSVLLFIAKPTFILCLLSKLGFDLSCALVFCPLLIKTNRLYQIFRASSKLRKVSKSAKSSVSGILVFLTISFQVVISGVCAVMWPVSAEQTMPVRTVRYVELSCQQDMNGFIIPLSYNILLLLLCCVFAFLTRTLPDNFNESWYILLSVSATLFVWIAFLPTYFSAFYASHKVALLGLALILNGLITVVCFFATKFYALFYVDEKEIKITNFNQESFEASTKTTKAG